MPRPNRTVINPELERPYLEIGQRLREFRLSLGMNQSDMEEASGHKLNRISRYEVGMHAPSIEYLSFIRGLGADLNYIITGK